MFQMTPSGLKQLVAAAQPEEENFRQAGCAPGSTGPRSPGRAGEGPRETRRQVLGETREIALPTTSVCGYRGLVSARQCCKTDFY